MIELKESNLKIFYSTDYSNFRMINGNRELNAAKIKRIQKDISAGLDVLRYCPILVVMENDLLKIIDGQHRFWVAKELKKPVYFVVVEKQIDLHGIAKINSNTETWKNKDFLHCYAQQGNEHYIKLQQFIDTYGFNIGMSARMLMWGSAGDGGFDINESFKSGRFTVKKWDESVRLAEACRLFEQFPKWKSRVFVHAIYKILQSGKCNLADIHAKFVKDAESLQTQGNYKDYLTNLEAIYNKNNRIRQVVY